MEAQIVLKNPLRSLFPIFKANPKLVYFDSAATSLKPKKVIDELTSFYYNNGMANKSFAFLSSQTNLLINETRKKTAFFLNCLPEEIIFTKGTTDSLNLLAQSLGELLEEGDEIIVSELDHNSSVLPWLKQAKRKKAKIVFVPLDSNNKITVENFSKVLTKKTKIVALTHVSNLLGYMTPIKEIIDLSHQQNTLVVIDAAQSAAHFPIDVKALNSDFLAFSAHKLYGPFGVGVLFGKISLLKKLKPTFFGGNSIQEFSLNDFVLNEPPHKFEAGTLNIAGIIAFKKALEFIQEIGFEKIQSIEKNIYQGIIKELEKIPEITIYNPQSLDIISFNFNHIHAHDVENFLAQENIYVKTGRCCAFLAAKKINQTSLVRISVGVYNNQEDIDILIKNLKKARDFFIKCAKK
ncbi:aminotransferase class V-fold PLP-dependent enzyme [Candidatus Phytoplasma australiense]|uniref:cysteine desulfurase n=1 Tax=Strawberry lethal yellows phytoplasma (CPA) str. NZSb11 TaxID=980422 RepID=R4S0H5_PHYAS|nr:aminotransferase class V-fold PLP-dependent enzyme [Candidatus Phytoplasma australiense]AGL90263.1 putative cysteine desulfurase [Strawberry lethal yellows phytoplasma (CPA) str. NZSb11]